MSKLSFRLAVLGVVCAVSFGQAPGLAAAKVLTTDKVLGKPYKSLRIDKAVLPDVTMAAGMLVDETGTVLWERNADSQRAMASITKIMTAVVALESGKPEDIITVPRISLAIGESSAGLYEGQKISRIDLIKALMVKSGNDAGLALATYIGGSEQAFVKMMNARAKDLGLTNTQFKNSHGLDAKGHYTSARDIAVLTRYAMSLAPFKRIVATKKITIGQGTYRHKVENTNLLLIQYDGANGVKTGWTDNAGYCVVGAAKRDGLQLYAVVLGTQHELTRFREAQELLDFGFAHFRKQKLISAGTVLGSARVADYLDVSVPAAADLSQALWVMDLAGDIKRKVQIPSVEAPVTKGDKIGTVQFIQNKKLLASVSLVATEDIKAPNIFERVWIAVVRSWLWLFNR